MKLPKKSSKATKGLVLVIAIVVIAALGFYALNTSHKAKTNNQDKSATAKDSVPKYLAIKEKGVKFTLSPEIKDAYYAVDSHGNINFSVHAFDKNPEFAGCRAKSGPNGPGGILTLVAAKVNDDRGGAQPSTWTLAELQSPDSHMKQVGDTWYGFMPNQSKCYDYNSPKAADYAKRVEDLQAAFVKADPTFTAL